MVRHPHPVEHGVDAAVARGDVLARTADEVHRAQTGARVCGRAVPRRESQVIQGGREEGVLSPGTGDRSCNRLVEVASPDDAVVGVHRPKRVDVADLLPKEADEHVERVFSVTNEFRRVLRIDPQGRTLPYTVMRLLPTVARAATDMRSNGMSSATGLTEGPTMATHDSVPCRPWRSAGEVTMPGPLL